MGLLIRMEYLFPCFFQIPGLAFAIITLNSGVHMVVGVFRILPTFHGHEPDVIEKQKREGRVGPFKVAPIKAYRPINSDTGNNCELNYSQDLFHVCSTKRKPAFGGP
jgi:hypothetical protein